MVRENGENEARRSRAGSVWLMAGAAIFVLIVACGGAGRTSDAAGLQSASPAGSTPESHPTTPADSSSSPTGQPSAVVLPVPSPIPAAGLGVPKLDTSIHDVPLQDIVFDTFNGRFVPLDQASDDLILSLRDAIAPVANRPTAALMPYPGWKIATWSSDTSPARTPTPIR